MPLMMNNPLVHDRTFVLGSAHVIQNCHICSTKHFRLALDSPWRPDQTCSGAYDRAAAAASKGRDKKKTHAISRRSSMPLHPRNPNNLPPSITANIQTLVNHCLCRSCLTANELVDDSYTNGWNTECILLLYERYACYTYTKFAEGYLSQLMIVFSYIKIGIYSICPEI